MKSAKMKAKDGRGFTLIELLIVVAIIGILSGILIPVFEGAMQKAKQKSTMVDIGNYAKAITSYITDVGSAPTSPGGAADSGSTFFSQLIPFQYVTLPRRDQWGNPFRIWTGTDIAGHFGIDTSEVARDDFLIQSMGRDGVDEGYTYDRASSENNFYVVQTMDDFNKDLIMWDGNWIRAPRAAEMRQ